MDNRNGDQKLMNHPAIHSSANRKFVFVVAVAAASVVVVVLLLLLLFFRIGFRRKGTEPRRLVSIPRIKVHTIDNRTIDAIFDVF